MTDDSQDTYKVQLTAEAKLSIAVKALKYYAYEDDDQGGFARTTLEEIGEAQRDA